MDDERKSPASGDGRPAPPPEVPERPEDVVLALERAALDRWAKGDPSGFLEICVPGVSYFDPFLERRLDGLDALAAYYESLRGKVHLDGHELLDPRVILHGDLAVLTFNYVSWSGPDVCRWNCTEVYRTTSAGWRIGHTHWSRTASR